MTVSSTSEWNYPETLAIEEGDEISELGRFIYDKVRTLQWFCYVTMFMLKTFYVVEFFTLSISLYLVV